jgi:peptidyl-tRNA hydrolase
VTALQEPRPPLGHTDTHAEPGAEAEPEAEAGAGAVAEAVPWALQLVARVERAAPPTHFELCEAAALAVVVLLDDPRSRPGGDWSALLERWERGQIRKLVRRARGAAWDRAVSLPGVTVERGHATVHALPPGPTSPLPPELVNLQVSGLDLERPDEPATPLDPGRFERPVTIVLNPTARLSSGKMAAQAGHAGQLAYREMSEDRREQWRADGWPLIVTRPGPDHFAAVVAGAPVVVRDAGFTETGGRVTLTALARWSPSSPG